MICPAGGHKIGPPFGDTPFPTTSPSPAAPLPSARYTGVGSVFHADPAEASAWVAERFPDFPFWPQLPARGESMLDQALAPPGMWACPGFEEILRRLPPGGWLKGQVAGPLTLSQAGRGNGTELARKVVENAAWQSRRILDAGRLPVIALDEPSWTAPTDAEGRAAVAAAFAGIRAAGAVAGVHSCGKAPWDDVLSLAPDFINPDVSGGTREFVKAFEAPLRAHVERGGWIGWGIVPTDRSVPLGQSRAILKEFLAGIAPLGDRNRVLAQSFLTPACGLAWLKPDRVEDVLRALFELSRFLRVDQLGLKAN